MRVCILYSIPCMEIDHGLLQLRILLRRWSTTRVFKVKSKMNLLQIDLYSSVQKLGRLLCTFTFTFTFITFFFGLRVRPMWPVGCSLVFQYKLARIKGVTTVSPVLVQSSFETIQWLHTLYIHTPIRNKVDRWIKEMIHTTQACHSEKNKTIQWTETRCPINFLTSMTGCSQRHLAANGSYQDHSEEGNSCWRNVNIIITIIRIIFITGTDKLQLQLQYT